MALDHQAGYGVGGSYENDPDPTDDLVTASTIAFWDLYLGGDMDAEQRLVDAIVPADLATLEYEPG